MVSASTAAVYALVVAQAATGTAGHALGAAGYLQGTGGAFVFWALTAAMAYMAETPAVRYVALGLMGLAEGVIFAAGIPRERWGQATGAVAGVTIAGLALGAHLRRGGDIPRWVALPVSVAFGAAAVYSRYTRYWPTQTGPSPGTRGVGLVLTAGMFLYETVRVTAAPQTTDAIQSAVRLSATGLLFSWAAATSRRLPSLGPGLRRL